MLHSLSLKFSDNDIQYAMDLLKVVSPQWSKVPRLYVVLKTIDRLGDIEAFVVQGITDKWFPFTITSFPNDIDLPTRRKFLENQWIVLTKAIDLEEGDKGTHQYFAQGETIPLESKGLLGQGSFGKVDRVWSPRSHAEYAHKRIGRGNQFWRLQENMEAFERELAVLKRLRHRHIVQLVGSYTDPDEVGLIFSPVADCNLAQFLSSITSSSLKTGLYAAFSAALQLAWTTYTGTLFGIRISNQKIS